MSDVQEKMIEEREREERRNMYIAIASSLGVSVLLLFLSMFWNAYGGTLPPIEEQEWRTIGSFAADFGTDNKGQLDVNNYRKPSETPADRPVTEPKNTASETPTPAQVSPPTSPSMESNTNSEATTQAHTPTKSETVTPPNPATKPDVKKPVLESFDTPKTNNSSPSNNDSGGSNDGDSNENGNNGNPNAQVLGEGQFAFGDGIGGSGGRVPLAIKMPNYNVQNEAKITFQFVIAPSGEVILVKPEMTTHTDLARIGADAIKRWRFSEVEPTRGNLRTTVTITFRLQ